METTMAGVGQAVCGSAARTEATKLRECLAEIRRRRARLEGQLDDGVRDRLEAALREAEARVVRLVLGWENAGWQAMPVPGTGPAACWPSGGAEPEGFSSPAPRRFNDRSAGADPGVDSTGAERAGLRVGRARTPAAPERSPSAAPSTPRTLVGRDQLERLAARFRRGEAVRIDAEKLAAGRWDRELRGLRADLLSEDPAQRAVAAVRFVEGRLHEAARWPRDVQHALLGLLSSVLREVQEDHGIDGPHIHRVFGRLTAFSREQRPGFVPGLSRANPPETGSWRGDVDRWLAELAWLQGPCGFEKDVVPSREELLGEVEAAIERWRAEGRAAPDLAVEAVRRALEGGVRCDDARLIELADPLLPHLEGGRRLRSLRQKIRRRRRRSREASALDHAGPGRSFAVQLRGRRLVLAGGMPREEVRRRLARELGLAELEWPELTGPRAIQDLAQRVRARSYDFAVLIRAFASHEIERALSEACAAAGVALVRVGSGYGSAAIRRAFEQVLRSGGGAGPERPDEEAP